MLQFRARCIAGVRSFFSGRGYLETDTPALSPALIPETCLEVFRTDYLVPFREGPGSAKPLWLVPSPEVYLKRLIADHGVSMFQISKCYRNVESVGKIHSPEFTMLEYYTMNAGYLDSLSITEALVSHLLDAVYSDRPVDSDRPVYSNRPVYSDRPVEPRNRADASRGTTVAARATAGGLPGEAGSPRGYDPHRERSFRPPFARLSVNDAFVRYAGFPLADCPESRDLARHAARLGLGDAEKFAGWAWDDLYELILVHAVEPELCREGPVFLMDYPARVACLAGERSVSRTTASGNAVEWRTKERWELYAYGVELANCYTEERDAQKINEYFLEETAEKNARARVPHRSVEGFGAVCERMPPCSGVAVGLDRLVMVLAGRSAIDSVLPFPLA